MFHVEHRPDTSLQCSTWNVSARIEPAYRPTVSFRPRLQGRQRGGRGSASALRPGGPPCISPSRRNLSLLQRAGRARGHLSIFVPLPGGTPPSFGATLLGRPYTRGDKSRPGYQGTRRRSRYQQLGADLRGGGSQGTRTRSSDIERPLARW